MSKKPKYPSCPDCGANTVYSYTNTAKTAELLRCISCKHAFRHDLKDGTMDRRIGLKPSASECSANEPYHIEDDREYMSHFGENQRR